MDWLLNLVPWWVWVLAAAIAIGAVWRLLGWQGAVAAAAGFIAVFGYGKGRADASRDAQATIDRRNSKASRARKEVDDEVDQLGSNDLDGRYRQWLRDDDIDR